MLLTDRRVRIAEGAVLHAGRLGYIVEGALPPVSGWVLVQLDDDRDQGKWFPPSKVESVKE